MSEVTDLVKPKGPFPLWLADFERDTVHLNDEQRYLYIKVLVSIWEAGGYILASRDTLSDLWNVRRHGKQFAVNCKLIESYLAVISDPADNNRKLWTQKRVMAELRKTAEYRGKQSHAGRKGGLKTQSNARMAKQAPSNLSTPTLTESTITTTENTPVGNYAFEGVVIKLVQKDFDKWTEIFPALNLERELHGLDLFWQGKSPEDRKRWFMGTFNMLRKKQEATEGSSKPKAGLRRVEQAGETRFVDDETGQQYIEGPGKKMIPISGGSI